MTSCASKKNVSSVSKLHTSLEKEYIIPNIKSKQGYCRRYLNDYANKSISMHRVKKIHKTSHNFSLKENQIKCSVHGWKLKMNKQLSERNGGKQNFLNFPESHYPDKKFCAIISKIEDPQDTLGVFTTLTDQKSSFYANNELIKLYTGMINNLEIFCHPLLS